MVLKLRHLPGHEADGRLRIKEPRPQSVPIREKLKEARKALQPMPYRVAAKLARRILVGKKKKKA